MFLTQDPYSVNFVFISCGHPLEFAIRLCSLVPEVILNNSVMNVTVQQFLYAKLFAWDKLLEVKLLDQGYAILNAFNTYFQFTLQKSLYSLVSTLAPELLLTVGSVFFFKFVSLVDNRWYHSFVLSLLLFYY